MSKSSNTKGDIQAFWESLYQSMHSSMETALDKPTLLQMLEALEAMFALRRHPAVVEMNLNKVVSKKILEIGSGAGGHSALFAKHGAEVTSVDLTRVRAFATQEKFNVLGVQEKCQALQADAESLPFPDDYFDTVYSNGVIHHTPNTQTCIEEIYRVLKPGGDVVLLLYCKSSWHYWINLFLCHGLLLGKAFKGSGWIGNVTEWGGSDEQRVKNPITKCYYAFELRRMLAEFFDLTLRKGEFYFYLIPKLGKYYRKYQIFKYGTHPGGLIVYGEPWPIQSKLELFLGQVMGFAWYIKARKPERSTET